MQCIQEELKSSKAEASSSAYPSSLSRSEGLAVTYQQIMTKVNEICAETIRDPVMRRDISDKFNEINILLCGAPRVGKSALINAICEKQVARTRSGLGACTRIISPYRIKDTIEIDSETISYRYNFWDTPGIESWTQKDIQKTLSDIKHKPKSDILCMIYCASPSSYANLEELDRLLKECMDQHIFCALVCTNKWSGQDEQLDAVMNNFQQLLERYHTKTREENGVVFFGNVGLCTAVNSETFVINRANITFEQSGIDELILGITESLDDEKLVQWLMLTFQNKRFRENSHIFPKSLKTILHKLSHKK
jgi:small GTP-binding protein